jgi:hypothetical protein
MDYRYYRYRLAETLSTEHISRAVSQAGAVIAFRQVIWPHSSSRILAPAGGSRSLGYAVLGHCVVRGVGPGAG